MKNATAIRHSRIDGLGSLRPLLESRGYRTQYRDADGGRLRNIDPLELDILIILGGPQRFDAIAGQAFAQEEMDLIRVRHHFGLPVLGIGLGAQVLAVSLGGGVQPLDKPEIALAPLELTPAGRRSCLRPLGEDATPVLHWHMDEIILPPSADRLATTTHCATQAFGQGRKTLGLQFHLEADTDHIHSRIHRDRQALARADIDPILLRIHALESAQRLRHAGHAVMTRWLDDLDGVIDHDG